MFEVLIVGNRRNQNEGKNGERRLLPLPSPKRPPRNRQQLPLPAVLRFEVKHTDRPDIDPSIDLCGILGFKWSFLYSSLKRLPEEK